MRLLDLDFQQSFLCEDSDCGNCPKILLFDGTTLSFQRNLLAFSRTEVDDSDDAKLVGR